MREIGIHLERRLVAVLQGIPKACEIGGAQPQFAGAVEHMHPGVPLLYLVGELPCAIGGMLLDDQHIGLLRIRKALFEQRTQILNLVIGWDNHQRLHTILSPFYSRCPSLIVARAAIIASFTQGLLTVTLPLFAGKVKVSEL